MLNGYIKLHRSMMDWEWYQDQNTKSLFIHCLLKANHEKAQWQGITIERGQFITSYAHLASELGLSKQNVRTSLNKLISTGELTHKNNNKNGLITVLNYDLYQDTNTQTNTQLTHKQHTTNNKQEEKELKEEKKYIKDIKVFLEKYENLPKIRSVTDKRKSSFNARVKEYGLEVVEEVFSKANTSEFLLGNNDRNWKADIDWLLNPNNFVKILEGKYNTIIKPKQEVIQITGIEECEYE